ncbi:hypothetical protein BpHYR1_013839 [Brachionus plicatilis]|uniref:Uncharacterized protein n=1 Tax=Brachionus plicatilis TaxID=10195 RepID=A0A3M7QD57_BRAPC|nr:hypothetical protein BpHYR1_013839 [Brachionus plicatilis]
MPNLKMGYKILIIFMRELADKNIYNPLPLIKYLKTKRLIIYIFRILKINIISILSVVVHTISWLCQNATKSGIPLPFNLDPCTFHTAQPSANLKQKSKILSYSSNTSLNQFSSSSVSSSLSSSSSFIQSTNNSGVSLSVIIGPGDSIKLSTPKSNYPLKQPNEGKEIACSSSSSCSDDISQYKLECIEYCGPKIELKQTMMSSTKTSIKADSNQLVSSASSMQSDGEAKHQQFPLIDSQCSPISTAHCAVSPRYVDTSSGRGTPNIPTPTSTTAAIPTRFFDRRVSSSAKEANPYRFNVNYSTAGQQLAKKAHEQLKTVEKSKELSGEKSDVAIVPRRKSDYINHDDESLNDDWQNRDTRIIFSLYFPFNSSFFSDIVNRTF